MTVPHGYRIVSPGRERAQEALGVAEFGFAFSVPKRDLGFIESVFPFGRDRAIETADAARGAVGTLAAVHASYPFTTRVPGGNTVATAGLSWVAVHPGHRRRGLLRAMMADHFSRSLARGEVISTLYAAETAIYQRFGYGVAASSLRMELPRGTGLREVAGSEALTVTIDSAQPERDAKVVRSIQAQLQRPGTATTLSDAAIADLFLDLESDRQGLEELRVIVVSDGEVPMAFALFQRKEKWNPTGPAGKVQVRCWGATTAAASRRLWSVLSDLDLMASTHIDKVAPDDPLVYLLTEPRGAKMAVGDNLWLRILDVSRALEGRGWSADCDIVVNVRDDQLPDNAGTWRIQAINGAASVTRTSSNADLSLAIQELSAAYLGGPTLTALGRASLVTENRDGAVAELSRALASDLKPVANLDF